MKKEVVYLLTSLALALAVAAGCLAISSQVEASVPAEEIYPSRQEAAPGNWADLVLRKTADPAHVVPGAALTYTLVFSNEGSATAADVVLTDLVPVSVTGVLSQSRGALLTATAGTRYVWQVADLLPGEGGRITITGVLSEPVAAASFTNTASITTSTQDSTLADNRAAAAVTIDDVAPLAAGDVYTTPEDTVLSVAAPGVLGNDHDANGDLLTAVGERDPLSGALALAADGSFVYTPALNFSGVLTWSYHAEDKSSSSEAVTVTIAITPMNDAPLARDDVFTTLEDVSLTVAAPGVLGNDFDAEGDPLTATLDSAPLSGTLAFQADGSFIYTPSADLNGAVVFSYHASDALSCSGGATVTVGITPANDPPLAVGDAYVTLEDIPLQVPAPGVLGNDSDVDHDQLEAVKDSVPGSGTLTLNADGSLSYTPLPNYRGSVSFTYHARDQAADSNVVTVVITMLLDNNAPLAMPDAYSTGQGEALYVPAPGVLANDADLDEDPLIAVQDSDPPSGTLAFNADGSFLYVPPSEFHGLASFGYHNTDTLSNSNVAMVSITVMPPPPKPRIYLPLVMRRSP